MSAKYNLNKIDDIIYSNYFIPSENKSLLNSNYFYNKNKILCHFTRFEAIRSIIENKNIRLYNLENLNDPRELMYAENIIPTNPEKEIELKENIYIISLSEKKGKKEIQEEFNMWRLYGENGNGCLIELELYNNQESWNNFYLSEIHYGYKAKENIVLLKNVLEKINKNKKIIDIDIAQLRCFHKSNLYKTEKEVRILFDGRTSKTGYYEIKNKNDEKLFPIINNDEEKSMKYNKKIKYLELPLYTNNYKNENPSIPLLKIKKIEVGYQKRDEFSNIENELKLLTQMNLGYIPVIKKSRLTSPFWGESYL